jgi:glycosyltransferase domain-containing protein
LSPPEPSRTDLTVVLPTRNRPDHVAAQLRFFRDCGLAHSIIIADSSDDARAQSVRACCVGFGEYRRFDPATPVYDKLVDVIRSLDTPYVVIAPDDDVTFPHAIDASLAYLRQNSDYVAAHGYVLTFGMQGSDFDVHGIFSFTPTIAEDEPLRRHYHLMRRYQPFIWAVFRTQTYIAATEAARKIDGVLFQELTFMNTSIVAGKVARLPVVFSMRGMEASLTVVTESHPFAWFLRDARLFFQRYTAYRDSLAQHIRDQGIVIPGATPLEQLLDMIHVTWLGRELNLGVVNHSAQIMLDGLVPTINVGSGPPSGPEPGGDDVVHASALGTRRYIWRKAVAKAEPREEITISAEEMADVERQLDHYHLDVQATP